MEKRVFRQSASTWTQPHPKLTAPITLDNKQGNLRYEPVVMMEKFPVQSDVCTIGGQLEDCAKCDIAPF